ncbi:MAG: HAD family hydrolase [Oligoflexia bacterium]|nr:HAD family hydrolase [Oligoflexia bacterium]
MSNSKAAFLDRDGTIIKDVIYLNDPNRIETYKESYEAIKLLNENGFKVILATNQSGVARGIVDENILKKINSMIVEDFKKNGAIIHDVYYCPHPVDGGCICRKPNAGMLQQAGQKYDIDMKLSWMVGDRMSDVEAGLRAGCQSILLQNETTPPIDTSYAAPKYIASNVLEAAKLMIQKFKEHQQQMKYR